MPRCARLFACLLVAAGSLAAQTYAPPKYLVSEDLFKAVATEFSGERAKENVRGIIQFHRIQASPGYSQAREWVVNRLQEIGVTDVQVEAFPSDGQIRYQTYVSPLAWSVREAELWVEAPFRARLCRFSEIPMCLSTLSNGGNWRGEVVHVGRGTTAADYEGQDVKGKVVLATGYASVVHREAVIRRGALGVLIYPAEDDRPEHPDMVRYNGLWPKAEETDRVTFGFQLTRHQAERLLAALSAGKLVRVHARVDARLQPGQLEVASAFFRGTDPSTSLGAGHPEQEIILIAHLDHPQWSANDNASGSAALVEIARTLKKLIDEKKITLRRTIRLMWVPEHFGTIAWLSKHRDIGQHAIAVLNLDMVGEDLYQTNSRLRITRTPDSRPSFLNDLVENVAAQVAAANLLDPAGTKNLFHYEMTPYDPGSDHDMFNDSTIGVPAIMFGHWPDWTHHTSEDTLDKVDPTTLKRVGVLATASALWLATTTDEETLELASRTGARSFAEVFGQIGFGSGEVFATIGKQRSPEDIEKSLRRSRVKLSLMRQGMSRAERAVHSLEFLLSPEGKKQLGILGMMFEMMNRMWEAMPADVTEKIPAAKKEVPKRLFIGPLADSYASTWFREQMGADYAWWEEQEKKIPRWEILVYETLNFTDGKRSLAEIEDAVQAEFGEVPDGVVEHILRDLEKIKLVEFTSSQGR